MRLTVQIGNNGRKRVFTNIRPEVVNTYISTMGVSTHERVRMWVESDIKDSSRAEADIHGGEV